MTNYRYPVVHPHHNSIPPPLGTSFHWWDANLTAFRRWAQFLLSWRSQNQIIEPIGNTVSTASRYRRQSIDTPLSVSNSVCHRLWFRPKPVLYGASSPIARFSFSSACTCGQSEKESVRLSRCRCTHFYFIYIWLTPRSTNPAEGGVLFWWSPPAAINFLRSFGVQP